MEKTRESAKALMLLKDRNKRALKTLGKDGAGFFIDRLEENFHKLFDGLIELYGARWDFFLQLENIFLELIKSFAERSEELRRLDERRVENPSWYQDQRMVGGMLYVDRFAGTIKGVEKRIEYLDSLGIRYLHLMPLFEAPAHKNDGGYAISSYRNVSPKLGTMEELEELASALRARGISLVLDFVFNHTSNEHTWARAARSGDHDFKDYYYIFADKEEMESYNKHLRDIFPDVRQGSFTWDSDAGGWVWTTFNSYQWDLNYSNPAVFRSMVGEMLYLANRGAEILRLDALAFVWKEKGTGCENLPKAHTLIRCFRAAAAIAAPALAFKSEAIVHPDEVERYISRDECELSYNPLLMALLWEAMATRETRLLQHSMQKRMAIHEDCSWVNYVRSHDDIGWTFADEDAAELNINGYDHRHFLNQYYTNRFPASFARGVPFQFNPATGDCRISGTCASLAGIEQGLSANTIETARVTAAEDDLEFGIRRHLLLHGVLMSVSGIPLLYIGDELAQLNWYEYQNEEALHEDSRWIHRPQFDWEQIPTKTGSLSHRVYTEIRKMISLRATHPCFSGGRSDFLNSPHPNLLAYTVGNTQEKLLIISNFSEKPAVLDSNVLRIHGFWPEWQILYGNCGKRKREEIEEEGNVRIAPLEQIWISRS